MDEQLETQPAPPPNYDFGPIPGTLPRGCPSDLPDHVIRNIIESVVKQYAAQSTFKHLKDVVRGL
jgi:hypothetical protein